MMNAQVQEHLNTYQPTADVRIMLFVPVKKLAELVANSNLTDTIKFNADIDSFEIVTDDRGQTVYLESNL